MKVSTFSNTAVERIGLADDGRFTIAFNSKMAKILADGIYSDKITSIIREISCNAIDSHVAAGKPETPIEVHLPGVFEPWFHVRDFGIGLDHTEVMNIYTVYGASTKTDTNDMVGCLGLGSKSPFSYVDAFDVTAIKNGIERQYSMYRSEDGMPSVALLMERKTAEPNGVTVKMPVLQYDFNNFKTKASKVFRWFNVKPTVVGMRDFEIEPVNIAFEGTGWKIRERNGNYWNNTDVNTPVALMGKVAYPIQYEAIGGITRDQRTLLSLPLVLEFNIGDLEIAASREALGYDNRTQANIKAKLDIVIAELAAQFEQQMKDAKTRWEACKIFGKTFGYQSAFSSEFQGIYGNHGLKWNNEVIKSDSISIETKDVYDPQNNPAMFTISGNYKRVRKMEYHRTHFMRCKDNTKIIFDDLDRGGASRINYYHNVNNHQYEITVFGGTPTKSRKEILELMGNPPYMLSSQLPKRPSNSGVRGEKVNMLQYRQSYQTGKKAWMAVDVEVDDGGIYVDLDVWTPVRNDKEFSNFFDTICLAQTLGILDKDTPIYAPRGGFKKKLNKMPEWENVFDIIADGLKQQLTSAVMQKVSDIRAFTDASAHVNHPKMWQTKWDFVDNNGIFTKFAEGMRALESAVKIVKNENNLATLNTYMGNENKLPAASFDGKSAWDTVCKRYPLIQIMLNTYSTSGLTYGENRKAIEEYVNLVDASVALPARKR